MGPNFIQQVTEVNKIAIVDTMIPSLLSRSMEEYNGLSLINKMEIICFKDGYKVKPSITSVQHLTVIAEKE